jgi:26S proteasome regulatory subunit (ATPase 3-interacting protein)
MPPRKSASTSASTTKPTTSDTKACSIILTYLTTQNRPYSATEISSNLHNAVTKARTDKLLKEMFERGEIAGKASGKQWVFWGVQVCMFVLLG